MRLIAKRSFMQNLIIGVGLFLAMACHEKNKNKISPAELMKSREIKKVSEAEILKEGSALGSEIINELNTIVSFRVNEAQTDCTIENWNDLDSLTASHQSSIQRLSKKSEGLSDLEYQLLEAYQYNLDNDLSATPAIQKLDQSTVLYTYPINQESEIFQYCMDSTERLRAEMWAIKIPIKKIVNRL